MRIYSSKVENSRKLGVAQSSTIALKSTSSLELHNDSVTIHTSRGINPKFQTPNLTINRDSRTPDKLLNAISPKITET